GCVEDERPLKIAKGASEWGIICPPGSGRLSEASWRFSRCGGGRVQRRPDQGFRVHTQSLQDRKPALAMALGPRYRQPGQSPLQIGLLSKGRQEAEISRRARAVPGLTA